MILWILWNRNIDAQYSSPGVLFGEMGTFAGVLTNACRSGFLGLFLSFVVGFFLLLCFGFFFFSFWRQSWVFSIVGIFLSTEAEISFRKPELLHRCGCRSFWRSWSVFRSLRCYSNTGTYMVTAVFNGFSVMMCLTSRHSRNS